MNKSIKKTSNAIPDKHQTTPLTDTHQIDLTTDKLFVYGSLNNDYHFQLLTGHKLSTKEAILLNHKRIRPKGGFPFALRWKGSKIEGRLLYNVTKEILVKLDDYESEGQLYKRKIAKVQVNGEILEAFVYVGKPKALKPYFQKGFAERDRIEEYVEKNVTRYLEGEAGRLIFDNPENLSVNVIRELLSEEIHSLMRQYFHDAGLPPFIIRHEIEKANIPNLNWLKTDTTARRYADNYIALAVRFMIFNQLEERFRDDYRSHLKVDEPYYLHTISAMVALKLLAKYHQQLETALLQLGVDRYVPDLQYTDYAVAAIYIAENLYTKPRADQIIDWVRSNRKVGMLPLGAELEFSNLGVRAVEAKEGEDPVYDSFNYFYDFDLMRRGWKLGAHVDDHGFLTSADIRTRGFLELAFGRFKLLGDISKPATQDPWILSNIIDLSIRFVNIKPHSLHLSIDIPPNTPFKKVKNPELFLCLLLLGGDLREDQNGKLREMRVFRSEIYHQKGGLFFSRLNRHHNNPEEDKWSFVVEYQFPRLHYEYDYQPLIMALKGFQIEANPYPFRNCKDFPFQEYYDEIEANIKQWAANPIPISKETINEFLNLVEKGLDMEASIISKEYEKYCQRIIGRIEEQLKRRNKRIINYHAQFQKDLLAVINDHREELIYRICNRLQGLPSSHYELIDYSSHQEREEEFMDILLQAFTDGNYHSFISYMEELASTRSNEGYSLDEVQKAINIIQDELTNIFITHLNLPKDVVKTLLSFFRGFGIAKDHAATIYLKEAIETQKELETLKQKFYAYRHDRKDHSNNKEP